MTADDKGFVHPEIIGGNCSECGMCVRACPVCTPPDGKPLSGAKAYAMRSRDEELRFRSSSGGAFSELAQIILRRGGCVAGAVYREDWQVEHRLIEREADLEMLRRSKYVQSNTGSIFREVRAKLEEGQEVLFCGTPCQAGGLRSFLGQDCEKLYLCDFICRGVSSPLLHREYLKSLEKQYGAEIESVWMKHKGKGWKNLSTVIAFANGEIDERTASEDHTTELYCRYGIGMRPSCYQCRFKGDRSAADITLGDFWGIDDPDLDDNMGVSAIICRTPKGIALHDEIGEHCIEKEKSISDVVSGNPSLTTSAERRVPDEEFWTRLKNEGFDAAYSAVSGPQTEEDTRRHIVIFGCGRIAKEFYQAYRDQVVIDYALSNDSDERFFAPAIGTGYEIRTPSVKQGKGPLIVVCTEDYEEIGEQLVLLGYTPFEDFMDFQLAAMLLSGKKAALFYGVCHVRGVYDCLRRSKAFMEQYEPFYYASYLPYSGYQQFRLSWLLPRCDLFVHNQVLTPRETQKNDTLLRMVKDNAERICIPSIAFGGYFPQKERTGNAMNRYAIKSKGYDYTPFSYGDSWLNECIDRELSTDEVLESLYGETAYDRDFILRYLEHEWKCLEILERKSDIRVLDYIRDNYRKRRLFRNEEHMENEVLEYYAKQVLEKLGLPKKLSHIEEPLMRCSEHVIYPGVAKVLGLEWDVEHEPLELYTYAGWKVVTPREFIECYLDSCRKTKKLKSTLMLP